MEFARDKRGLLENGALHLRQLRQLQNSAFTPFVFKGNVSISPDSTVKLISVLRDKGAAQSFILESILPLFK